MMITYIPIRELRGKKNKNLEKVMRYIAKKEGYLNSNGEIQLRNLFNKVIKPEIIKIIQENNLSIAYSRKQFKRMRTDKRGRFPINIVVYLCALYNIMLNYNEEKPSSLKPFVDHITYTQYIVGELKNYLGIIVNQHNHIDDYLAPQMMDVIFRIYNQDFHELDEYTGQNKFKIYNDIW